MLDFGAGSGDPATPSSIWADWDDVDAALMVGLSESETTVLQSSSSDGQRAFELLSISGRTGMLTITRDPTAGHNARGSEKLTITASMEGPSGPDQARRAKRGVMQRLEDLAGVDYAPIR